MTMRKAFAEGYLEGWRTGDFAAEHNDYLGFFEKNSKSVGEAVGVYFSPVKKTFDAARRLLRKP